MTLHRILLLAGLVLALSSCSSADVAGTGADATFPADPLEVMKSDGASLTVTVRTSPSQPPPRGTCAVELVITDAQGNPRDGLTLDVVPWMPAHGHGASAKPTVTPKGNGRYVVSDVSFFMPGDWELRTTVSGPLSDHVTPHLTIP
jgi:hypothetical protein